MQFFSVSIGNIKRKVCFLLVTVILYNIEADARPIASADTLLLPKPADLSIRFQHIEPRLRIPGLIAAWTMDEGSGYEFLDISENKHTAYIIGASWNTSNSGLTSSFRKTGKRAGSVYLDGSQWLQVKDTSDLNMDSAMSIALWIKPEIKTSSNTVLVSRENVSGGFSLLLNRNTILLQWKNKSIQAEARQLVPNTWTHVSLTINQPKKEIIMYINGREAAKHTNIDFSPKIIHSDLFIGGMDSMEETASFKGYLDEVCLYNKTLSPAAVNQLYVNGLPQLYTQSRATIDSAKSSWTTFRGNQFIPHPAEKDTRLLLRFNGDVSALSGIKPDQMNGSELDFIPGIFGGAWVPRSGGLVYQSVLSSNQGTFEAWLINRNTVAADTRNILFRIHGQNSCLELYQENKKWIAELNNSGNIHATKSKELYFPEGALLHVAITWQYQKLVLWINGVLQSELNTAVPVLNGNIELGGSSNKAFEGIIDDVRISETAKTWGAVCPTGYTDSESAALDFMDGFDRAENEPLFRWQSLSEKGAWSYKQTSLIEKTQTADGVLVQKNLKGFHVLVHPDAFGISSSIEAGIVFDSSQDGWSGIVTNADAYSSAFSGITFSMNPKRNQFRMAVYKQGKITAVKYAAYDFPIKSYQRYTLTLSVYQGILKGFVDGNSVLAMEFNEELKKGCGGLFSENCSAGFDDIHFTALTPAVKNSRVLQTKIFTGAPKNIEQLSYTHFSYNAFRWKKRYGLLPWKRTFKVPEPAGNIFGPDKDVQRPNSAQSWRSEDSANSDIILVDGMMYYSMRGNPDLGGPHGNAAIGMLSIGQSKFDGIHFHDLNADSLMDKKIGLLHGHIDNNEICSDKPPRHNRLQVNDQGMVYIDGKILIMAREFRNRVKDFPKFKRLVFGLFDIQTKRWVSNEPFLVEWSSMDPDNCFDQFKGINATPEIFSIKNPQTDETIILLYYTEFKNSMVIGLRFDGEKLTLHPDYPSKQSFIKADDDRVYGQRIFFDNGIYYMHVNAGSSKDKLRYDWPDRFQLLTALDPYSGPWVESSENTNILRPYFTRGNKNDPDNAAIWQGTIFKHRNQYFLYYENYHAVKNIDNPYDLYDNVHSGSRVGFAIGN